MTLRIISYGAIAGLLLVLSGCASTSERSSTEALKAEDLARAHEQVGGAASSRKQLPELNDASGLNDYLAYAALNNPQLGDNTIRIEVTDATGKPADVESVWLELRMHMPGMRMQATAQLEKGQSPGVFNGTIRPIGQGEWHASIGYENPKGKDSASFTTSVGP